MWENEEAGVREITIVHFCYSGKAQFILCITGGWELHKISMGTSASSSATKGARRFHRNAISWVMVDASAAQTKNGCKA
jgi:hypothetical protein